MSKLPSDIKLIITRKLPKNEKWQVEDLLEILRNEVESREMCLSMTKREKQTKSNKDDFTASALVSNTSNLSCTYCKQDHKSSKCTIITDVKARRAFLRNKGRCFLCLRFGHVVRNCQSKHYCFKCSGKHHISICEQKNETSGNTLPANVSSNVFTNKKSTTTFLQTAQARFANVYTRLFQQGRVIFDSGSQRSFVTEQLRNKLKLQTLRKEKMILKGFGNKTEKIQTVDIVQVRVFSLKNNYYKDIELCVVPFICSPISNQMIELAQATYEHLIDLPIADSTGGNSNLEIEVLIGGDNYWSFFSGRLIKGKSGPVAMESILGYVLSGEMKGVHSGSVASNFVVNHVLRICVEDCSDVKDSDYSHSSDDNKLDEQLSQFWRLEGVGVDMKEEPDDSDVFEDFQRGIQFDNERYTVKLPWKTDSNVLPDNYKLSLGRNLWADLCLVD